MSIKIKNNNNLNNSPYTNVVNGPEYTTNNYYSNYEDLTFTKESIDFLNHFSNLKDYIFNKLFNKEKKINVETDFDLLGIKIFDWIFGLNTFPSDEYRKLLCGEQSKLDIYNKRRLSLNDYFSSNLEKCVDAYDHMFSLIDSLNCSENYKNDILIDGRNINIENNSLDNKYVPKEKFQKKILDDKKNINTPLYDRIKVTTYEKSCKNIFEEETLSKNSFYSSSYFVISLNHVQDLILLTLYNGSITHLKLCRNLIFNLLYNYTKVYDDITIYENLLYLSALSFDYKSHTKIKNYIKRKYNYQLSYESIERLYSFKDIVNKQYIISYLSFFYSNYKYYIDSKKCIYIEKMLLGYIYKNTKPNINFIGEILKAFSDSTRVFDYGLLFKCIDYMIKKKHIEFYGQISEILNSIELSKLNDRQYKKYVKIVKRSLRFEHAYSWESVAKILIKNNKTRGLKKYLNDKRVVFYFPDDNDFNQLVDVTKYYNELYEEKEKNPKVDRKPDFSYNFTRSFFEDNSKNLQFKKYVSQEVLNISSKILESPNQSNYLKSEILKLLIYIFSNSEYNSLIDEVYSIINNTKLSSINAVEYINFLNTDELNEENIKLQLETIKILLDKNKNLDLFFEKFVNEEINSFIYMGCIIVIAEKYKDDNRILEDVYKLYKILMLRSDYYERYNTIYLLKTFSGTIYNDKALEELKKLSLKCDFDEAKCIKKVIESYDENDIKEIKNNLLNSNDIRIQNL